MKYHFHDVAERELEEGVLFYEQQQDGLGARFFGEIEATLQLIIDNPFAWERMDE